VNAKANEFYAQVGEYAKNKGVSISVITLKGQGCNVEILGQIADTTNGNVTRVDASSLGVNFNKILEDEVVATNVEILVLLHKGLKFRNENKANLSEDESKTTRKLGNATRNTQVTLEYDMKNADEIRIKEVDLQNLNEIPLQTQVFFQDKDGNKYVRVLTQHQKITDKKEDVEKNADIAILATNATQKTAQYALEGKLVEAKESSAHWQEYISNNIASQQTENNPKVARQMLSYQAVSDGLLGSMKDSASTNLAKKDDGKTVMFKSKKANMDDFQ